MNIHKLYWWSHNNKIGQYSTKKVHDSVSITKRFGVSAPKSIDDYEITEGPLEGLKLDIYEGV